MGWHLEIPAGDARHYRLSQLDDQHGLPRRKYSWRAPASMRVRARVSSTTIPGTWGFGFWNDPYGFSCGPGDSFLRLPALPQAAWFFHASPQCYLSFRDDRPARGLMAQVFRSPRRSWSLIRAGVTLPFARRSARRTLSGIVSEDSAAVTADPTTWREYQIRWSAHGSEFRIDDHVVLSSSTTPLDPLGFVVWIDNQYAAFTPDGELSWGLETSPQGAWLELDRLQVELD